MKFVKVKRNSASTLWGNIRLVTSGAGQGRGGETAIRRISSEALEELKLSPDRGAGNVFIWQWPRSKIKRKSPVRIFLSSPTPAFFYSGCNNDSKK